MPPSRSTGLNYMGLNELINMIYNFMTFSEIHWLLILAFQKSFPLMATMTYNKLRKYTFANKDETFFSLYLIPPAFGFSSWLPCGPDGLLRQYCN